MTQFCVKCVFCLTADARPTNPCPIIKERYTVAKPELGTKRHCQSCATKFYDLQKDPILCPKCGTVFVPALLRGQPEIAAKAVDDEDADVEVLGDDVELVSLDEVEAEETGKDLPIDDVDVDVEIEGDLDDDETFLEEEEERDDDVIDLIDGDIEKDEEV